MAKKPIQSSLFNFNDPLVAQCKLPNEWFKIFENLDENDIRCLVLLSFVGDDIMEFNRITTHIKGLHTQVGKKIILTKLSKLGLVHASEFYSSWVEHEIHDSKLFSVMLYALDRFPEYIAEMKKRQVEAKIENELLWKIVYEYYRGTTDLRAFRDSRAVNYFELHRMLDDFVGTDFLKSISTAMIAGDFFALIDRMLTKTYLSDVKDNQATIDYCWELYDNYWQHCQSHPIQPLFNDYINMHEFIFTGRWQRAMSQTPNHIQSMTLAVQKLYQGKEKESLALFEEAMKVYNKNGKLKNVIPQQVICFYLLLCYAKLGEVKKASIFAKKSEIQENPVYSPAILVAWNIILNDTSGKIEKEIKRLMPPENYRILRMFGLLFARFNSDSDITIPKDIQGKVPHCALLRYEMSATGMPCCDREELRKALGGEPILSSFRAKPKWESLLEGLKIKHEAQSKPTTTKNRTERLIYVVEETNHYGKEIHLYRQKPLKSGGWGKPFSISHATFLNKSVSFAAPIDYEIIKTLLAHKSYHFLEAFPCDLVLPHLIGSDKVFYFNKSQEEFQPVQVTEQKPYIQLEKNTKGYIATSNVPIDRRKSGLNENIVSWFGNTQAVIYRLSTFEREAIYQLCTQGKFPLEAEKPLQAFIHAIGNQLEVHSNLIEGGSLLEKKQALSNIVLRLEPTTEGCALGVHVSLLEDSKMRLFPGRGMAVVYDESEGKRYQIDRNLSLERQRLDLLQTHLIDTVASTIEHDEPLYLELEGVLSLLQFVSEHSEEYKVEWPEGRSYKLRHLHTKDVEAVKVISKEKWFEIEGELKISEKEVLTASEMLRLLQQGKVGKNFVRLNDDEFIALSDSLAKQLQKLEKIAQIDSRKAIINRLQVGELAKIIKDSNNIIKSNENITLLVEKIQQASIMPVPHPKGLQAQLRDYQQLGYEWMSRLAAWGAGGCLADDMGLGKTVQAIAFLLQRAKEGASMVVAPASVVFNWQNELQRFAPTLRVHVLNEAEDRKKLIKSLKDRDILLTTYGLLVREEELLTQRKWNVVCLDEAHTIKNRSTKMSQVAMELQAEARLLLTGTPVQNHLGELWNLFQFLNPGLLGSYEWFNRRYIQPIEQGNDERRSQLRKLVQPFILRRTKGEVVEELPDKIEMTRQVELSATEYAAYEAVRVEAQNSLEKENKVSVSVLSEITRLREAACSLSLINKAWAEGSSKLDDMSTLVSQIVEGGNRVLIFSQFTSFLTQAKAVVDAMEIDSFYLDGSTPLAKRKKMVEQFQEGEKSVFFISLKAGGLGLNLTGANYVIHLDPWWNPAIEQQATDRAYRIGQEQKVTVYHLIAKNTIEEKILRLHQTKRDIADSILEGTNSSHALNLDDLRYLLEVE